MERRPLPKSKIALALDLFWFYFRIGFFTFGGGWSLIAQVQREFVEKRGWITDEELLDMTSLGRSLPGTMIANVSWFFGARLGGPLCGAAAVLGIVGAPLVIMSAVTFIYASFRENVYVARALVGVRAAVAPIILQAVSKLLKPALRAPVCWAVAIGTAGLYLWLSASPFLLVVLGAAAGLLYRGVKNNA